MVQSDPDLPDSILLNQMPSGKVANYLYQNKGDLTFKDVSSAWGVVPGLITQGVAYSDLDNDGDLDLVLNNLDTLATIKENTTDGDSVSNSITIKLEGGLKNTKAIGAKIEVYHGLEYQFFEAFPVRGFKSSVDNNIHVGLGQHSSIDSILVYWPGGNMTRHDQLKANQVATLRYNGQTVANANPQSREPIFKKTSNSELGVDFVHIENNFVEFNREPLIPFMHSREGPALAVADINQDGLEDFFIGGAKQQSGNVYLQTPRGFELLDNPDLLSHREAEDVDAVFLDFDNDGDQDLVVVSGGNEYDGNSPYRKPRLYLNNGQGKFEYFENAFGEVYQTGSCISVSDFDGDGWLDIFLGSLVVPRNYGLNPKSYLLQNSNGQRFTDVSDRLPQNGKIGMVNDAIWVDLNGTGKKSLVLAGEWMEVTILHPTDNAFELQTIPQSSGWWKTVAHLDYDGDGDQDLVLGNLGLNSKLKASESHPVRLYLDDLDQNGRIDPILTYSSGNEEYAFSSRDLLQKQIPSLGNTFQSNKSFSEATLEMIFGKNIKESELLTAVELRSGIFVNEGNTFRFHAFPNILQISTIQNFLIDDLTGGGDLSIFSVGNLLKASTSQGMYAADRGTLIAGFPNHIQVLTNQETGISLRGDVRKIETLNFQEDMLLMVAINNDSINWYKRARNFEK